MITSKQYQQIIRKQSHLWTLEESDGYCEYRAYLDRKNIQRLIRPIIRKFNWSQKDGFVARVQSIDGTFVELKAWRWDGQEFNMRFDFVAQKEFSFTTRSRPKAGDAILIHAPVDGSFVKIQVLPRKNYWREIGFWET
jgi:hypothetical protein